MKKAKTKNNLISIFSAIFGVVFAFLAGITYAPIAFSPDYITNLKATSAYMANQQCHIVNDTVDNPIAFGEGVHNTEVALQYSVDYDFDVRIQYQLVWTNSLSTENVILHFANRDNIIYDENYIFLTTSISAGADKIPLITAVDFINTSDSTYFGQTLTINIVDVKIYKTIAYTNTHPLYVNISTSPAAQAWYNLKTNTSENGYVMVYNQRRNFENGVPYPGLETAYKKVTTTTGTGDDAVTEVSGSTWLGGNKAYAGVGLYVIAGSSDLEFEVEIAGIWRLKEDGTVSDADPKLISENSIKFNYTSDWDHTSWDSNKLWETRTYKYVVTSGSTCYINVLDNIEVSSASRVETNLYDSYRAVINSIELNASLGSEKKTTFTYTEASYNKVQIKKIYKNADLTTVGNYSKQEISIVNASKYANGLYTAQIGKSASDQTFNTSISLINNDNSTKTIQVDFKLMYYISNGSTLLTTTLDNDETVKYRIEELIGSTFVDSDEGKLDAFINSGICYGYALEYSGEGLSLPTATVTLAPYSSINVLESYSAPSNLQKAIKDTFGVDYDVWTYLEVTTQTITSESTTLLIESSISGSTVNLSVKNNTDKAITGVTISNLSVKELGQASTSHVDKKPSDWDASYWKYFYSNDSGVTTTPITRNPITDTSTTFPSNVYQKVQIFSQINNIVANEDEEFTGSDDEFSSGTIVLQPGESVVFATATLSGTKKIFVSGTAETNSTATPIDEFKLINNGKKNAFIMNNSEISYYVSFTGKLNGTVANIKTTSVTANSVTTYTNYYIGIIRPGQIFAVPMLTKGEVALIPIESTGIFSSDTLSTWDESAVAEMEELFAFVKKTT